MLQFGTDGIVVPPPSGVMSLKRAGDVLQTILGGLLLLCPRMCVHLVISGERASEERLRVAEYGLATALAAFWHRSHVPAGSGLEVVWWGRGR
jgi:hypothetical protein